MIEKPYPVRHLFGVPIHALSMRDVLAAVDGAIRERRRLLIGVVNAAKLVNMHRDRALGESVLSADVILADGMSVVWACRLLGRRLPERVAGIDLMEAMLGQAQQLGHRVFCLGATQEILDEAIARMEERHPGVQIVGRHNGYFKKEEEAEIAEAIRTARADILFVAMTSPKKEQFLAKWSDDLSVPVCHGVGGAFDVVAGKVRRAPALWQRLGIEWLYRVLQEPGRMWKRYLITNTLFCGMLVKEIVLRRKPERADRSELSS